MINGFKRAMVVLAMMLGIGAATASPASADFPAGCYYGEVCIYLHSGYSGDVEFMSRPVASLRPYGWNDKASSICNRSGGLIKIWQHDNYLGYTRHLANGACWSNLQYVGMGPYGANFNDQISSISW